MMGRTHATTGVALALASVPPLTSLGLMGSVWSIPLLVAAAAGGAMMPDFDHRKATIAQSLGPLTMALAKVVEKASGGHRNGTHSFFGAGVFTAFTALVVSSGMIAGDQTWARVPAGVWCGFLFAVGLAGLQIRFSKRSIILHTLLSLAGGIALVAIAADPRADVPLWLIVWGFAIGYLAHLLAGDILTKEGVPLLWPANKTRFHVASFTTGQFFEKVVLSTILAVVISIELYLLIGGPLALPSGASDGLAAALGDVVPTDALAAFVRGWGGFWRMMQGA